MLVMSDGPAVTARKEPDTMSNSREPSPNG